MKTSNEEVERKAERNGRIESIVNKQFTLR